MQPLPIDDALPAILAAAATGTAVVRALPGSGKTTRIPPALVRSGLLPPDHPVVLVLEPRRAAARAAAARIAAEQGWTLGREIGYQVRFDKQVAGNTRLRFLTEGVLTQKLAADPFLEGIGAVMLDEFHERSLDADLALALLQEVRRQVRPDLILLAASATLDPEPVARHLGGCPIVDVPGALHPVALDYRPALIRDLDQAIASAVRERLDDPHDSRHILVFLPGMAEIRRVQRTLATLIPPGRARVLILHGSMPLDEQDRVLAPGGDRKIILATNVAETSLTIEGVGTVIDSGLERRVSYDPSRGVDRHETAAISRASADQRAGRAGRTGPGLCIRLYSERDYATRLEQSPAEIHRVDLAGALLLLEAFGARPEQLDWYEPPDPARVRAAQDLLRMLGAVAGEPARITSLGRDILKLPLHPRLGRLVVEARRAGRPRAGATLAALLAEPDVQRRDRRWDAAPPPRQLAAASDVIARWDLFQAAESARFNPRLVPESVDVAAARHIARVRDDLLKRLRDPAADRPGDDVELLEWLLAAYPDRLVKARGAPGTGLAVGGRGARLAPGSRAFGSELFLAVEAREIQGPAGSEITVDLASPVRFEWLERKIPQLLSRSTIVTYDHELARVTAVNRLLYLDLVLREDKSAQLPADQAGQVLFQALAAEAETLARANPPAARWLAQVEFLRAVIPELPWPIFDQDWFVSTLETLCQGQSRRSAVEQADWVAVFESRLDPTLRQELRLSAPETITLPKGRSVSLTYEPGGKPPILAAKVQDFFGWRQTPRIARGRAPVVLHLLAPNGRPAQITSDLASFWTHTYAQVRKDLRRRYPKHAWPEDPLANLP